MGVDALGDISTNDVNSNGLATVAIDPLNSINQFTYDSHGNVTEAHLPGRHLRVLRAPTTATPSRPLTRRGRYTPTITPTIPMATSPVIQDPLNNLTTMTYTGNGQVQTVTDANNHVRPTNTTARTGYHDDQRQQDDRALRLQQPGRRDLVTDQRGNATTYSYDALDRETGMTDPLGNHHDLRLRLGRQPDHRQQAPTPSRPDRPDDDVCL